MNFIQNAILGFAVGDAMGCPIEFMDRKILELNPLTEMVGYGSHEVPEGTWTDDTSLVIATMDSIIEKNEIDYNDIMFKFSEWYTKAKYTATDEIFDIGISTKEAIHNYIVNKNNPIECGLKGERDNGNGSLMRILPIVFFAYSHHYDNEILTLVINDASSLTHAHEISKMGCKLYADYIINLLNNGGNKIKAYIDLTYNDYSKYYSQKTIKLYQRILDGSLLKETKDNIKSTGFVVDTLEASIWCTLNSNSYEQAIINSINLGNDTDTIGAITGSINGIIYGLENIPTRWLNKLRKKEYLQQLIDNFTMKMNYVEQSIYK